MEIEFYKKHNLKKKLLIADRDGTLNFDCGYPHKIKDLSLLKFVIDQIEPYSNVFEIAIVTNQSGIGRGLFTENQVKVFNQKLVNNLNKKGIVVTTICISGNLKRGHADLPAPLCGDRAVFAAPVGVRGTKPCALKAVTGDTNGPGPGIARRSPRIL